MIVAIFLCDRIFGWSSYIGDTKMMAFLSRVTEEHLGLAVLIYTVLTVVGCVLLSLPGITFAVLAGLLFGPVLGTICCSVATTLGAMAAFLAGRFFLKDSIKPVVMKNRYIRKWLFDETRNNELFVLMITRLVPLFPFNLQNFAYGVTDIRFRTYAFWSLIFMLPGTAMYTVGTAGLADRENRILYLGIAAILAVAVSGAGIYFKKRYVAKGSESEEGTGQKE